MDVTQVGGAIVGLTVGDTMGVLVGAGDGFLEAVGRGVGGKEVVGALVVGFDVGTRVGYRVGIAGVGLCVGANVGLDVGFAVVGLCVGANVGLEVGGGGRMHSPFELRIDQILWDTRFGFLLTEEPAISGATFHEDRNCLFGRALSHIPPRVRAIFDNPPLQKLQ